MRGHPSISDESEGTDLADLIALAMVFDPELLRLIFCPDFHEGEIDRD